MASLKSLNLFYSAKKITPAQGLKGVSLRGKGRTSVNCFTASQQLESLPGFSLFPFQTLYLAFKFWFIGILCFSAAAKVACNFRLAQMLHTASHKFSKCWKQQNNNTKNTEIHETEPHIFCKTSPALKEKISSTIEYNGTRICRPPKQF